MAKARKPVNRKKVLKIVLISLVVFIVLNLIGAAVGTSISIAYPSLESYEDHISYMKSSGMWGNFDSYDTEDYIVKGLDGYELRCTSVSSADTRGTGKYVIISHGHQNNHWGMVKFVDPYIELGFTCIIYDLRGHGKNERTACSMGGWEAQDLNFLIEDTFARFGDVALLGLQGESMGTSTSLNVLKYTDKVDFIVADCGFQSLKFMVHDMYNDMYLYPFGACADLGFRVLFGINDAEVSGIDALKDKGVPILFVHGADDNWIDVENSEAMYKEAQKYAYSELWLVPGAEHCDSREVAGKDAYRDHIANFLEKAGIESPEVVETVLEDDQAA